MISNYIDCENVQENYRDTTRNKTLLYLLKLLVIFCSNEKDVLYYSDKIIIVLLKKNVIETNCLYSFII